MKSTGIVICNYNKCSDVINCIQSVLESDTDDFDLYVVDNGSTDDSVAAMRAAFSSRITILCNQENLGGSGGFNTGLRMILEKGYPYIWCLDNDVLVDEQALSELIRFLKEHPEVGMAGSKVYHRDTPDYIQQYGLMVDFEHYRTVANYANCLEDGSMPNYLYCDAVAACSVVLRRETLVAIGLMPEENFLYWDDTEWGMRCNNCGYKVASVGASRVLHAMGAKKEVVNTFSAYYAWRNRVIFFLKYTPDDKIPQFCDTLLRSVFEVVYGGYYRGEQAMAQTVLYALDDALHGCMGRADACKIMDVDTNDSKLSAILRGYSNVAVNANGYDDLARDVLAKIAALRPDLPCKIISASQDNATAPTRASMEEMIFSPGPDTLFLSLCDYIFTLPDTDETMIYIDTDWNILTRGEEDLCKVLSYHFALQAFLFSYRSLFLTCARQFRDGQARMTGADSDTERSSL